MAFDIFVAMERMLTVRTQVIDGTGTCTLSPCGLMAGWCGRVTIRETDCVAGHIGLEVRRETGKE